MSDERAHGSTEAISNTYSMNDDDLDDRIEENENGPLNGEEQEEQEEQDEQDENENESKWYFMSFVYLGTCT